MADDDDFEKGQHIEREARYEATGLTDAQRDQMILELTRKKWSQHRIAKKLGLTQPAIHYALIRLSGGTRNRAKSGVCDLCWRDFPADQLNRDGLCSECEKEVT